MATSQHFVASELQCHCGCKVNGCTQKLVDALEAFRMAAGSRPVIVDSAYRCLSWNKRIGGASSSQHLLGTAADVKVLGMTAAQLEAIAFQVPAIHGVGRCDSGHYLHVDVRRNEAHWCYGTQGKWITYYPYLGEVNA